jgi:hypothetical protein
MKFVWLAVVLIVLAAAGFLYAAGNTIAIKQITGPGVTTGGRLLGWLANGNVAFITPGTNLSIDSSGNLNAASVVIPAGAFVDNAVIGNGDGTTTVFTLASAPNPATSLQVFVGGLKGKPGTGNDYTLSGLTLTFTSAPSAGANIEGSWRTAGF